MIKTWLLMGACLVPLGSVLRAQTVEFLPEIDFHGELDSNVRFVLQAKDTRENGIPKQAEIGPSMEFYWRPLRISRLTSVDETKIRFILLSIGYRYLPGSDAPATNRILWWPRLGFR